MTSCTLSTDVENLLKPPKLSEEQEQIYQALIASEGSKISLKYPRTGNYLSAFIVENIDNEPSNEAIVL